MHRSYLKDWFAELNSWKATSKVAQHVELGCTCDSHRWAIGRMMQQQPFQTWSILNHEIIQVDPFLPPDKPPDRHGQGPEPRQAEARPAVTEIGVEHHSLDPRAIRNHPLEELFADANFTERKVGEAGEGRRAPAGGRQVAGADVEHAERRGEAESGGRQLVVAGDEGETEDELLERVELRQAEPGVVDGGVAVEGEESEGEAAGGAPVSSDDLGDDLDAVVVVVIELEAVVEVERRGALDRVPAAGEDGGADAILSAEEGDDDAEDAVREAADQIQPLRRAGLAGAAVLGFAFPGDGTVHQNPVEIWGSRKKAADGVEGESSRNVTVEHGPGRKRENKRAQFIFCKWRPI